MMGAKQQELFVHKLMIKKNLQGFTLLEAFLAAFIFIISVAAIFVTMTALRKPAVNNEQGVKAALMLRDVLEELRAKVDSREGGLGALQAGNHPLPPITQDGIVYTLSYFVTVDAVTGVRSVTATANYTDAL